MLYRSFEALNQELNRMGGMGGGRLYLSRYVTLESDSREAEAFLGHLEEEGYLPPTVAWIEEQGKRIRLFRAPDGAYSLTINCNGMILELRTGGRESTHVMSQWDRKASYELFGDLSFLIMNPARLPRATFDFLRILAHMPQGSIDPRLGKVKGESRS